MPATTPTPPLLRLHEVSRTFAVKGGGLWAEAATLTAVHKVSLHIDTGEPLGLVGESGCGKSTLGRMIAGLLPPSSGEILLEGQPLYNATGDTLRERAGLVQMIFQDPFSSLNPRMRVGEAIAEPLLLRRIPRPEREARVRELLELVGLDASQARRYPHEFSGGQRQRVAVARALVTHPRLVVCDEPVSALDASVQAQVLNLLREIRERFAPAYLFISHDLAVVSFLCTRIAVMYLGRIMEIGPRDSLLEKPAHPYTAALLAAMPRHDPTQRPSGARAGIQGELPSPLNPPSGCPFHPRCPDARPQCATEPPPWRELCPAHHVRCHLHA